MDMIRKFMRAMIGSGPGSDANWHESLNSEGPPPSSSDRSFGLLFAAVCALIAVFAISTAGQLVGTAEENPADDLGAFGNHRSPYHEECAEVGHSAARR